MFKSSPAILISNLEEICLFVLFDYDRNWQKYFEKMNLAGDLFLNSVVGLLDSSKMWQCAEAAWTKTLPRYQMGPYTYGLHILGLWGWAFLEVIYLKNGFKINSFIM